MTFKWPINFFASNLFKILSIVLAMGLVVALAIERGENRTSADTEPTVQTFITDSNGSVKTTFEKGETGYLTLRSYAKEYSSAKLADVMLIIDRSGSMNPLNQYAIDKCTQAQDAAANFVNAIDTSKDVAVGVVSYSDTSVLEQQLRVVDSSADKQTIINNISWSCSGGTDMTEAINTSDGEFAARARAAASRYAIFFTDGGENTQGVVPAVVPITETAANNQWFQEARSQNRSFAPSLNSSLDVTKRIRNVKYYTVYYGLGGNTADNRNKCTYEASDGNGSWGCPLMRYVAGYTNNLWNTTLLPTNIVWNSDYRASDNNVDDNYFYKASSGTDLNNIFYKILESIEAQVASLTVYQKLSTQVQFDEIVSAKDKGGRSYPATIVSSSDNLYQISLPRIPTSYSCDHDDSVCMSAAQNGEILSNYVDLKFKITFLSGGNFDLGSNYNGCDTGAPTFSQANSKVDYYNAILGTTQTVAAPALCVNIIEKGDALVLQKTTYRIDPQTNAQTQQATFEAGDEVAVKLIVKETLPFRDKWKIEDKIPSSVSSIKGTTTITPPGGGTYEISSQISSDTLILQSTDGDRNTFLIGGTNVIEYHYKI